MNYSFVALYTPNLSRKVSLVITTQPLFPRGIFNVTNLKYRSRYVIVEASDNSFVFNYMHPDTYYCYALYDNNGDNTIGSGDWISESNVAFTLDNLGVKTVNTEIDFTIP